MNPKTNGRLSVVSFCYILLSVAVGAVIAIILFFLIEPGKPTFCPSPHSVTYKSLLFRISIIFSYFDFILSISSQLTFIYSNQIFHWMCTSKNIALPHPSFVCLDLYSLVGSSISLAGLGDKSYSVRRTIETSDMFADMIR